MRPLIPFFDHPKVTIPLPFELPLPSGSVEEITIYGFGIMVALGFLVGAKVAVDRANRVGLSGDHINQLIGWLVVGTFVGGHVGYALMYAPHEYLAEPIKFLYVWEGLSSFGGIVTCIAISVWFFRKHDLAVWPHLDSLAMGMAIGWALGRTGCTLAHDHPGLVTEFWLGRQGICLSGGADLACHDLGMYEAIWSYAMFGVLFLMDRRPHTPGVLVLTLGTVYGPVRFLLDFLRPATTDPRYLGLTAGQWWAMVFFGVCLALLVRQLRSGDEPVWRPPGAGPPDDEGETPDERDPAPDAG